MMKQHALKIIAFFATSLALQASVTVTATARNILTSDGSANAAPNTLALFVISTSDAAFGSVKAGSIAINNSASDTEFIDNNDDAIFASFATAVDGFSGNVDAGTAQSFNLDSRFTAGDRFAIYWFPTITFNPDLSTINLTAGTKYGIVSSGQVQSDGTGVDGVKNWVIPADTQSPIHSQPNSGAATFTVVAVPEPTSTALLGLGGLSLLMRRRRA